MYKRQVEHVVADAAFARLGYDVLHACEIFPGKANRGKASFAGAARVSVLRVR